MKNVNRRYFLKLAGTGAISLTIPVGLNDVQNRE